MREQVRNMGQQTSDIILVSSQVSVSTGNRQQGEDNIESRGYFKQKEYEAFEHSPKISGS